MMNREKKYHLVMSEYEAEYMISLLDGCIGTSESDEFTKTFSGLLKQLNKKLNKANKGNSEPVADIDK